METIRKKICLDNFLSHRPGIVPYCKKDSETDDVIYISSVGEDSNYGSFACDFILMASNVVYDNISGLYTRQNTEISRFRYLDIINRYNEYLEKLNNGIKLKRIAYTEEQVVYQDCTNPENSQVERTGVGNSTNNGEQTNLNYRWTKMGTDGISMFDFMPVPSSLFTTDDSGNFYYRKELLDEMGQLNLILNSESEVEEFDYDYFHELGDNIYNDSVDMSHIKLKNKVLTQQQEKWLQILRYFFGDNGIMFDDSSVNDGKLFSTEGEYIILIDDYESLKFYEDFWDDWWTKNFELCDYHDLYDRWEKIILDFNYSEPANFKFIYDVEKYLLGKIKVPENLGAFEITGSKVPNTLYYMNYMSYLDWFNENVGNVSRDKNLKKIWDSLGGQTFYDFLNSITPRFFKYLGIPENGDFTGIIFGPPTVEIPLLFVDEAKPEGTYKPYELSVDVNSNITDGTIEYVVPGENKIGSGLTPRFESYSGGYITVESKLNYLESEKTYYLNDKIYGLFSEFEDGGEMFECTYHTGQSSRPEKSKYYTVTLKEYGKINRQWTVVNEVELPEVFDGITQDEKLPNTGQAYQTVGVKKINSTTTTGSSSVIDKKELFDDGNRYVTSSYTYYTKTTTNQYSWWSCKKVSISGHECGDGENIDFGHSTKYRNLLLLSCVPSASETTAGTYFYLVKYDNGFVNPASNTPIGSGSTLRPLTLPYEVLTKKNVTSLDGEFSEITIYDMLLSRNVETDEDGNNYITFNYVLGATEGEPVETSGIHYSEKYPYTGMCRESIVIDGVYNGEVIYQKYDTSNKETVYSDDYMLERKALISEITGMEISTQWTSASCINAYLFTEESSDNLAEYPDISVDISYNRGNSAAWEKRFKLSECNTMEDLENYGNNYFNL